MSLFDTWFDAIDYLPQTWCYVELPNGKVVEAVFEMGTWEDREGNAVYPVRFKLSHANVVMPLYKSPLEG